MNDTDDAVEYDELEQFVRGHRENAPHQHLLDVLGALRGAIHDEDGGGGSEHIQHADERLLPHATGHPAAGGEQQRAHGGENERIGVCTGALHRMPRDHGHGSSQCRDLRQRKVGEHDVAPQHLETEPRVNAGEDDGGCQGQRCECEYVLEHARSLRCGRQRLRQRIHVVIEKRDVVRGRGHAADRRGELDDRRTGPPR